MLVIVYYIFRKIFKEVGYETVLYPLIASMIFCTLFNKDEIYPWPILSFGFAYICYISTIYLYLNKEKKYYLCLSCIVYFLATLTYESGITIPAFLLLYDYLFGKNWKKSLYFAIPLTICLAIRATHWFGFGWDVYNDGLGTYGLGTIIATLAAPVIASFVFLNNLINSFYGYTQMSAALIIFLIIINVVLLTIIYKYLVTLHESNKFDIKLIYVAFLMILVFSAPYLMRGVLSAQTREYYFIDIGIALLIVCVLIAFTKQVKTGIFVIVIIGLGLFINQGLYYNWVIGGELLEKIDTCIGENTDELLKYDYIYFNTRSFTENIPNGIKYEIVPFYLTVQDLKNKLLGRPPLLKSDTQYDYGYNFYYNARALEPWALKGMISERKKTNYTLIYGNYVGTVPIDVTKDTIIYKNLGEGSIFNVSRDKVFEINYSSVVSFDRLS
ncbi:MAG: hypothetical protein Q7V05_13315 [Methanoregula sp.]|nr:hypothetical protein [Methanoregula sp.]